MTAHKGNRQYTIVEAQAKAYQKDGYDIYDDSGIVVMYGAGKTIPYDKHEVIVKALKEEIEAAKRKSGKAELEALKKENKLLQEEYKELQESYRTLGDQYEDMKKIMEAGEPAEEFE